MSEPARLFDLEPVEEAVGARRRRYCRCENHGVCSRAPDWDVWPDFGWCRTCALEVHPKDVRRSHAITIATKRGDGDGVGRPPSGSGGEPSGPPRHPLRHPYVVSRCATGADEPEGVQSQMTTVRVRFGGGRRRRLGRTRQSTTWARQSLRAEGLPDTSVDGKSRRYCSPRWGQYASSPPTLPGVRQSPTIRFCVCFFGSP